MQRCSSHRVGFAHTVIMLALSLMIERGRSYPWRCEPGRQ